MRRIAGHDFSALAPGEFCKREGCQGMRSLAELMSQCRVLEISDRGVAHTAQLLGTELEEIRSAKVEYDAHMRAVMGF